jgi:radical SAM superfamily enzyme YgiQ (UPF0313 family)
MRVLLVSPNVESLPDPVFPLGLAYIMSALKKNGIHCQALDLCFVEDYEAAIEHVLDSFQPHVVCLSLRNLDNVSYPNYTSYLPFYRQVVQTIKRQNQAPVVLGGSGFTLVPESILEFTGADFGIVGEGEFSLISFLNRFDSVKGFDQPLRPTVICEQTAIVEDLDGLPLPDRSGFDNEAYLKWGGMGNLQTKRGCPFGCIYCTYPIVEGVAIRLRDPKSVCDEIGSMLESGINNIFIVDNVFNYPLEHAQAICEEIIRRNLTFSWSCYLNPKFVTSRLLELMLAAGCSSVEFGSDAGNQMMLHNLGKNFTVDDLSRASAICNEVGMSFCHSLLLGGPGETMETVQQTLDTITDMSPTAIICMLAIRVFPKTKLSLIATEEGIIGPEENFLNPIFYLSPAIKDDIVPFIEHFSKQNPNGIFPGLNININPELQKKLRRIGIKGPLWESMKLAERFRKIQRVLSKLQVNPKSTRREAKR